ncbi:MAG: hypothetical protein ACI9DF_003908, partial [Verrucomicrobiales bacterium]
EVGFANKIMLVAATSFERTSVHNIADIRDYASAVDNWCLARSPPLSLRDYAIRNINR